MSPLSGSQHRKAEKNLSRTQANALLDKLYLLSFRETKRLGLDLLTFPQKANLLKSSVKEVKLETITFLFKHIIFVLS